MIRPVVTVLAIAAGWLTGLAVILGGAFLLTALTFFGWGPVGFITGAPFLVAATHLAARHARRMRWAS